MEYARNADVCDGKVVRSGFARTGGTWTFDGDRIELRAGGSEGAVFTGDYVTTGIVRLDIQIDGRTHSFGRRGRPY